MLFKHWLVFIEGISKCFCMWLFLGEQRAVKDTKDFLVIVNPLFVDVNCRRHHNFAKLLLKNAKFKFSLPDLDLALKMHWNEYKQA